MNNDKTKRTCYAALDMGISRIKIGVWSENGIELIASRPCPLVYGSALCADSVTVQWSRLQTLVEELLRCLGVYCAAHNIDDLHLGLCGQVSSVLVWDKEAKQPLDDTIPIWLDRQSAPSVALVQDLFSKQRLQDELGTCLPLACNWLLVKLHHYMQENSARIANKHVMFMQLHDAVFHLLTQEFKTHPSAQVSIAHTKEHHYAADLLGDLGLSPPQFPELSSDGSIAVPDAVSSKFALPQQSRVYVGLADMYAGFNGFFLETGDLLWQCNTSEIFAYCGDADAQDVLLRQRLDDEWVYYGSTNSGGQNINWFMEQIAPEYTLEALTELASKIPAGSEALLYLPFLSGERAPHWDSGLSSSFIGLQPRHSKAHMFRALLEGVAFNKRHILEFLPQHAQCCKIAGGSSVNALWNEIRCHIIGVPLQRIIETEVALLGVLRFMATINADQEMLDGLQKNLCGDVIAVDDVLRKEYDHYYQLYDQAQKALKPVMQQLNQANQANQTKQLNQAPKSQPANVDKKEYCDA